MSDTVSKKAQKAKAANALCYRRWEAEGGLNESQHEVADTIGGLSACRDCRRDVNETWDVISQIIFDNLDVSTLEGDLSRAFYTWLGKQPGLNG